MRHNVTTDHSLYTFGRHKECFNKLGLPRAASFLSLVHADYSVDNFGWSKEGFTKRSLPTAANFVARTLWNDGSAYLTSNELRLDE